MVTWGDALSGGDSSHVQGLLYQAGNNGPTRFLKRRLNWGQRSAASYIFMFFQDDDGRKGKAIRFVQGGKVIWNERPCFGSIRLRFAEGCHSPFRVPPPQAPHWKIPHMLFGFPRAIADVLRFRVSSCSPTQASHDGIHTQPFGWINKKVPPWHLGSLGKCNQRLKPA